MKPSSGLQLCAIQWQTIGRRIQISSTWSIGEKRGNRRAQPQTFSTQLLFPIYSHWWKPLRTRSKADFWQISIWPPFSFQPSYGLCTNIHINILWWPICNIKKHSNTFIQQVNRGSSSYNQIGEWLQRVVSPWRTWKHRSLIITQTTHCFQ